MKKQILSILLLVVAIVMFNSCEKEAIEAPATENTTNESLKQNPIETIVSAQISRMDSITPDLGSEVESRSSKQLLYQGDITLHQGQWALASLRKAQLGANYIYSAKVTPYSGDPDLYIHGRQPGNNGAFRQIRSSRNPGTDVEEETASVNDLTSSEDRLYFSIYAQTGTRFILEIFKEQISTPTCTSGCNGFLANENWTNEQFIGVYGNYFEDVTGDGKADAIALDDNQIRVRRATGSSFAPEETWYNYPYWGLKGTFFADVTGDGKADAIAINDHNATVSRSTGSGFAPFEVDPLR
ncbi:MAG: VCBS repeat-containing protein [Saprospiraceae bacterium]|nr:VCBS repeat-containing protein [Saprospiraceae bacterium]